MSVILCDTAFLSLSHSLTLPISVSIGQVRPRMNLVIFGQVHFSSEEVDSRTNESEYERISSDLSVRASVRLCKSQACLTLESSLYDFPHVVVMVPPRKKPKLDITEEQLTKLMNNCMLIVAQIKVSDIRSFSFIFGQFVWFDIRTSSLFGRKILSDGHTSLKSNVFVLIIKLKNFIQNSIENMIDFVFTILCVIIIEFVSSRWASLTRVSNSGRLNQIIIRSMIGSRLFHYFTYLFPDRGRIDQGYNNGHLVKVLFDDWLVLDYITQL